MPRQTKAQIAAHAAYRVGVLDIMLHPDTLKAMKVPGILKENMEGEREWRLQILEEENVDTETFRKALSATRN